MKKILLTLLMCVGAGACMTAGAFAQELVVGGQALGIEMSTSGAMVEGLMQVEGCDGACCPAREAGIEAGDVIVKVSGRSIASAQEFISTVTELDGEAVELEVLRAGESTSVTVQPVGSPDGRWMMGLILRDGIAGIGTLTFVDPDTGIYGALGHSITSESMSVLPLNDGSIRHAQITDVVKGANGQPGELNGSADAETIGSIEQNTPYGIYGHISVTTDGSLAPIGEVTVGEAVVVSTVDGGSAREYRVNINRVYREGGETRFMLTVADDELCRVTGGIVQGMSGSPVVQDGRLVGAVTHVLVSTRYLQRIYVLGRRGYKSIEMIPSSPLKYSIL